MLANPINLVTADSSGVTAVNREFAGEIRVRGFDDEASRGLAGNFGVSKGKSVFAGCYLRKAKIRVFPGFSL